ncbi:cysteine hydrolase family protein [Exilibacterium tricleocarpae]|uniref:cysteine hydrolase family protein n=1 Tax=Exilibacterium tricleocarpae TaxID=2591008 RepID=UPI001C552A0B|nr:isochorismatase family cysteine hydrolase [Exilibacterium tricleocarpae]
MTGASTALVLVDIQNSFFHPAGSNYYEAATEIVPNLHRLLRRARASDRLVVHVSEQHRPDVEDFEYAKLPEHCIVGSHDAAFFKGFGPAGNSNEFLIDKRRMSAFFATDLDLLLREKSISRLVIAGVKANVCVRATVQDAFSLGYRCLVPRQAVNSNRPHLADAALEDIDRYMGWAVTLAEAEDALS